MFNELIIRRQSKNFCKNMLAGNTLVKKEKSLIYFPSFSIDLAAVRYRAPLANDQSACYAKLRKTSGEFFPSFHPVENGFNIRKPQVSSKMEGLFFVDL